MRKYKEPQEDENLQEISEKNENEQNENRNEEGKGDLTALISDLEENKAKAEEYYGQLQRLKAEFDNFRKRTQKEKEEIAKYGSERIVSSLLPVLDNFERAIDSTRANQDFESFSQGVGMIFRQLFKVLEDEGLKPIEAVGQEFDPNIHEALMREESDQNENMVLAELQKGYTLKDKVIRVSKVKVSG